VLSLTIDTFYVLFVCLHDLLYINMLYGNELAVCRTQYPGHGVCSIFGFYILSCLCIYTCR
jgi:hypothetical protein